MNETVIGVMMLAVQGVTMVIPLAMSGAVLILCMSKGWLRKIDRPIDFGATLWGQPLLGPSKSFRGAIIHLVVATAVTVLLHLASGFAWVAPQYQSDPLPLGVGNTVAYLVGEMLNSFVKRRLGISPRGKAASAWARRVQALIDNVDGTIMSGVFLVVFYRVSPELLVTGFVVAVVVHAATDSLMRRLRLKRHKQ